MLIERRNALTGENQTREIPATEDEWRCYLRGEDLHSAMPRLSVGDRRFIIYGVTEDQWTAMFFED